MLIQCTNCQGKIRVPDSSVGKKGKCPKCGTVLVIPAVEHDPRAEKARLLAPSASPEEPDIPEVDVKEAPAAPEPQTAYASTLPPPVPSAPAPVRRASRRDDDDTSRSQPVEARPSRGRDVDDSPRRSQRDVDDSPRRSQRDDDDDYDEPRRGRDDDLNIRRSGRRQESIAMSLTAMILGISGLVVSVGSIGGGLVLSAACCCFAVGPYIGFGVSGILGVLGVVFGVIGLKRGGKGLAWTGIATGGVNLVLILVYVILTILGLALFGFGAAMVANQPPQQNFGMPPRNIGPGPPVFRPQPNIGPGPVIRRR
jgi:predicted Zn finger-like uncharacterized protein